MDANSIDEKIEVSKAAKLILDSLSSEKFESLKDMVNSIPDRIRIKLFNSRYEYSGMKTYDSVDFGFFNRFRFIKYVNGKFKMKETFGLHGDPEDEFQTDDLHRTLKYCFYECNTNNAIAMKRLLKLANEEYEYLEFLD